MSKNQWGHGYHKGYDDAKNCVNDAKYILTLADNGYVSHLYIVREKHGDVWTCELFDDPIDMLVMAGMYSGFDENEIDITMYEELNMNEIGDYKLFYSQKAMFAFLIKNYTDWYEKNRKDKRFA